MRMRFRAVLRRRPRLLRVKRRAAVNVVGQLAGAAGFEYGLWQVWEPLAWLVGGAALVVVSFGLGGER